MKVSKSASAFDDQSTDIPDNTSFFPDDVEVFSITPPKVFLENSLRDLKIPSFSATNSVLRKDINLKKTNIFKTLLIPGPASDYGSIYTALMQAQRISVWTCGAGSNRVLSLYLDLYVKCYLLVHSRRDMRDKYILCLGELHAVFAHIGNLINSPGIEGAWFEAAWYDSECITRHIRL